MKGILFLAVFSVAAPALAEQAEMSGAEKSRPPAFGQASVDWLELQRSGAAGSENMQAATSVVQEKAVKRFMDTYNHPLPEFYKRDSFVSGGR